MKTCKHHHGSNVDRRHFMRTAGTVSVGAGVLGMAPTWSTAADATPESEKVDVGLARGSSMQDAVYKAVELAGGMDFIQTDQTVLIKPNCTGGAKNPTTTSPEVLYAVIKLVNDQGPKRIIVSDRCFSPVFKEDFPITTEVMEKAGHMDAINQAISDFKAPVVAVGFERPGEIFEELGVKADTPHWRKIKLPEAENWPNGFELAELLFQVDHVINVPVIKTHFQAWFTMSMKAFVGMSSHDSRREFHGAFKGMNSLFDQKASGSRRRRGREGRMLDVEEVSPMVKRVAELNLGLKPSLNILDGTQSFVFGGPSHGDTAEPKLVIASRDRVAADVTGVAVLKRYGTERRLQRYSVWENPFIQHGAKIGLGIDSVDKLNLKHSGADDDIEIIKEGLV